MSHSPTSSRTLSSFKSHTRYELRVTDDGVYENLIQKISELGTLTLGGSDFNKDFVRRVTDNGNYKYLQADENNNHTDDFHFIMFGQTCPTSLGTKLASQGNNNNFRVRQAINIFM